jgi:hypothetical protein
LSWAFLTLGLPLLFAYAINLPYDFSLYSGRRATYRDRGRPVDVVTFAITKALLVFAVFYRACPIIPFDAKDTIAYAIGAEILLLNSIIAFVYGIYDAIIGGR